MIAKLRQNIFLRAIMINILFAALLLIFFEQKYEMSDDFVMEGILSGAYGNGRNPRMIFVNVIYGYLLLPLYNLFPKISWYFISYLLIGFISLTVITYIVLKTTNWSHSILLISCLFFFFGNDVYILIQFTKVAGIALVAGSFLLVYTLFESKSKIQYFIGAILCLLGAMIRFDVCLLVGPFAVFWVLVALCKYIRTKKQETKYHLLRDKSLLFRLLAGIAVVVFILFCRLLDRNVYEKDQAYSYFLQYSKTRAAIGDQGKIRIPMDRFDEIGITINDELMIGCWEFCDGEFFTDERLNNIADAVADYNAGRRTKQNIIERIKQRQFFCYPIVWACIVIFLAASLFLRKGKWRLLIPGIIGCIMLLYFACIHRMVYRVEYVIFLSMFVSMLYLLITNPCKSYPYEKQGSLIIAGAIMIWYVVAFFPNQTLGYQDISDRADYINEEMGRSGSYRKCKYKAKVADENVCLIDYIHAHEDNFYFLDFASTIQKIFYDYNPYRSAGYNHNKNFAYSAGVMMNHPDMLALYERWGITNPTKDLLMDNVYLIDTDFTDYKLIYLREHYDSNVEVELVDSVEGYNIWKFYRKE